MKRICLAFVIALLTSLIGAPQSLFAVDSLYFDATNSLIDPTQPVGTQWHELYPNFCMGPYTITGWADNGDGELSHCDIISLHGPDSTTSCHHVLIVTITLELERLNPPDQYPHYWDWNVIDGVDPLTEPVCTWWKEVYPDYGGEFHIAAWEDNQSGVLDSCDAVVDDSGAQYHVKGVHTDMVTEPTDECVTDPSTWGRIKALYE